MKNNNNNNKPHPTYFPPPYFFPHFIHPELGFAEYACLFKVLPWFTFICILYIPVSESAVWLSVLIETAMLNLKSVVLLCFGQKIVYRTYSMCVCVCLCDCVREDSVTLLICLAEKLILLLALFTFFCYLLSGPSLFEPVMTLSLRSDNRGKGYCTLWAQMSWWNFKRFICISKLNWYWYIWKSIKV